MESFSIAFPRLVANVFNGLPEGKPEDGCNGSELIGFKGTNLTKIT